MRLESLKPQSRKHKENDSTRQKSLFLFLFKLEQQIAIESSYTGNGIEI